LLAVLKKFQTIFNRRKQKMLLYLLIFVGLSSAKNLFVVEMEKINLLDFHQCKDPNVLTCQKVNFWHTRPLNLIIWLVWSNWSDSPSLNNSLIKIRYLLFCYYPVVSYYSAQSDHNKRQLVNLLFIEQNINIFLFIFYYGHKGFTYHLHTFNERMLSIGRCLLWSWLMLSAAYFNQIS
jgi:hypothetical protein